ncbi:MAG: hypothetical protein VX210_15220 [Myxococcota bacterium]|nr:hypothetical protein [Myxococcota bacterium]
MKATHLNSWIVLCLSVTALPAYGATCIEFYPAEKVGEFESGEISESSGLAISRAHPDILWTHNDSGDTARFFASGLSGQARGIINLSNGSAQDWEAMAIGPCAQSTCLFIGDVGDNAAERSKITFLRLNEPTPTGAGTSQIVAAQELDAVYPDEPQNSEAIAVDPLTGDILVIEKSGAAKARAYRIPAAAWASRSDEPTTMTKLEDIDFATDTLLAGQVTGIDIAPSGSELYARTYTAGFHVPLRRNANQEIIGFEAARRADAYDGEQCEAVAYDGTGLELWFTCEDNNDPIAMASCRVVRDDETGETTTIEQAGCGCNTSQSPLLFVLVVMTWLYRFGSRRAPSES